MTSLAAVREALGATTFVALSIMSFPGGAEELNTPSDRDLQFAVAAFRCAALAAGAGASYTERASPLAERGYEAALRGYPELLASMKNGNAGLGPLAAFLTKRNEDFWIGIAFIEASKSVEAELSALHPFGTDSFEMTMASRAITAGAKFHERNCELLAE